MITTLKSRIINIHMVLYYIETNETYLSKIQCLTLLALEICRIKSKRIFFSILWRLVSDLTQAFYKLKLGRSQYIY